MTADLLANARKTRIAGYHPPSQPSTIAAALDRVRRLGVCEVCGDPVDTPGVTCKAPACVRAWVGLHGRRGGTEKAEEAEE